MYTKAIVRKPGRNFHEGNTTASSGKPDFYKALGQHGMYCDVLRQCGLDVTILEADEKYPDGCFVEDTAIITEKIAVITRPGVKSRQGEEAEIAQILSSLIKTETIKSTGTLDGGDVMRVDNHFLIGISGRTNRDGSRRLCQVLSEYGYSSSEIIVGPGLHLKTGVTYMDRSNFIAPREFALKIAGKFPDSNIILVDKDEAYAANCLLINDFLLMPAGFPKTKRKIAGYGYRIIEVDVSEFRKMDGGLTCLSLLF
jgi:dimethylargininase